jgi:dimethylargininase
LAVKFWQSFVCLFVSLLFTSWHNTTMAFRAALCRGVPSSFVEESLRAEEPESPISLELAKQQHQSYIDEVSKVAGIQQVFHIPEDDAQPDCMYIEDTCVVIDNTVVITQPGHEARRGEIGPVRSFWQQMAEKDQLKIYDMSSHPNQLACCDGGDVLTMHVQDPNQQSPNFEREVFVGLSRRTNENGVNVLREAFLSADANLPRGAVRAVHSLSMEGFHTLHLKSLLSGLPPSNIILVADTE